MGVFWLVNDIIVLFVVAIPFMAIYWNVILLLHSKTVVSKISQYKVANNWEAVVLCIGLSLMAWVVLCGVVAMCFPESIRPLFLTALAPPGADHNGLLLNLFRVCYSILLTGAAIGGPLALYISIRSTQLHRLLSNLPWLVALLYLAWDAYYSFSLLGNATYNMTR
jgi:hypothetical protein